MFNTITGIQQAGFNLRLIPELNAVWRLGFGVWRYAPRGDSSPIFQELIMLEQPSTPNPKLQTPNILLD